MPLTTDTIEKLDRLLDIFFEKIGRKERIKRKLDKLFEENLAYLKPKVDEWLKQTNSQIISDLNTKFIKKVSTPTELVATLTDWEAIEDNGKRIFKPAVINIMAKSGDKALEIAGIEASFDVLRVESVAIAEKICSTLVREVTDNTKKAISKVIKEGVKAGKNMGQVAKEIRPLVGLTTKQTMAVVHYNEWLIENRPEWSLKEINASVGAYERKMHRRRADTIARTETARAQSEGTLQGYGQGDVKKVEWIASSDCCPDCDTMNGEIFTVGDASGMQPRHPKCRCCWAPVIVGVKKPEVPKPVSVPVPGRLKTPGEVRSGIEKIHKDSIEELAGLERQSYRYQKRSLEFKRLGLTDSAEKYKDLYLKEEAKIDFIRIRDNIKMRKMLQVSDEGFNLYPEWAEAIKEREKPFFKNAIKEFSKLIDKESTGVMFPRVGKTAARSFYSKGSIYIGKPSILYENTKTVVHELGHWLEDMNPKVHESIMAFYKKRTKGEGLVRLLDGFGADELTRKDKFIDAYMGKDYEGKASEILSMGLGEFYKNPYRLATKDPGYFDFIYNLVRGKY